MKKINKSLIITIIILIILLFLLVFSLKLGTPNHQLTDGFFVTIEGKVILSGNMENTSYRPPVIYSYYSEYKQICGVDQIKVSGIKWNEDKSEGEYILTFWLPVEMNVVLVTDCRDCNYKEIFVSRYNNTRHNVTLIWNGECYKNYINFYNDPTDAINNAISVLSSKGESLEEKKVNYNTSNIEDISSDLKNGWVEIQEKGYTKDINQSLLNAYRASFYAWRADSKMGLFDMEVCLKKIEKELKVLDNSSCYIPPYEGYKKYQSVNSEYRSGVSRFNTFNIFREDNLRPTTIDETKDKTDDVFQEGQTLRKINSICREAYELISTSLNHQKLYCKRKEISIFLIKFDWLLVAISVGILIGRWVLKGDK